MARKLTRAGEFADLTGATVVCFVSPLSSGKIKLPALPPSLQPLPPASLHTTVYGIACEAGSTGEGDGEVVRKARKEMSRVRAAASKQSCGGTARDAAFRVTKVELGDTLRVVLAPDVGTEGLDLLRMGRNHSGEWHMTLAYVKDGMSLRTLQATFSWTFPSPPI